MVFRLHTLKKRTDFLRLRNGRYTAMPGLILQARKKLPGQQGDEGNEGKEFRGETKRGDLQTADLQTGEGVRFGFTVTKKVGNAVVRNRIKRRLRAAVRQIAPQQARADFEYVLIGRKSSLKRPFSALLQDLAIAFARVHGNSGKGHKSKGHRGKGHKGQSRGQGQGGRRTGNRAKPQTDSSGSQ